MDNYTRVYGLFDAIRKHLYEQPLRTMKGTEVNHLSSNDEILEVCLCVYGGTPLMALCEFLVNRTF